MAKKTNTALIAVGVVGLVAVVYLVTRKQAGSNNYPTRPTDTAVARSQLLGWAQSQPLQPGQNIDYMLQMIKNFNVNDLWDYWDAIFGASGGTRNPNDYSGGGDETGYDGVWV